MALPVLFEEVQQFKQKWLEGLMLAVNTLLIAVFSSLRLFTRVTNPNRTWADCRNSFFRPCYVLAEAVEAHHAGNCRGYTDPVLTAANQVSPVPLGRY
jgi:hypothetical protein